MKIYAKAGIFLLMTGLLAYTPIKAASIKLSIHITYAAAVTNNYTGYFEDSYLDMQHTVVDPVQAANERRAKIELLRKEIVELLINALQINREEAENIVSATKYLTPGGRDINKTGIIQSKLEELKQLESMQ